MKDIRYFRAATAEEAGDNWIICFGAEPDGTNWYVTTDHVHASEAYLVTGGAKVDAQLVAELLNKHFESLYGSRVAAPEQQKGTQE